MSKEILLRQVQNGPWIHGKNSRSGGPYSYQELVTDPETGMFVRCYRYNAGTMVPAHTHPCAHGIFVLQGTLVTNKGNFGPGGFVWFEEGSQGFHGAGDEEDLICLFITNKGPFSIQYVEEESISRANKSKGLAE